LSRYREETRFSRLLNGSLADCLYPRMILGKSSLLVRVTRRRSPDFNQNRGSVPSGSKRRDAVRGRILEGSRVHQRKVEEEWREYRGMTRTGEAIASVTERSDSSPLAGLSSLATYALCEITRFTLRDSQTAQRKLSARTTLHGGGLEPIDFYNLQARRVEPVRESMTQERQ